MEHFNYVLVSLYFLCSIYTSVLAATECYQCSTATNPNCAELTETSEISTCKTTTGDEINCLMYEYKLNNRTMIYRGCRQKDDTCEDIRQAIEMEGKVFLGCQLCDTDLCKSGITIIKSSVGLLIIAISFIFGFIY